MAEDRLRRMLGEALSGLDRDSPWKRGEKAQGADAQGAAAERRVALMVGRDKEMPGHVTQDWGSVQGDQMKNTAHKEGGQRSRRRRTLRGAAARLVREMEVCWPRVWTAEGRGLDRTEVLLEARGDHGDAADPVVEGISRS